MRQNIMEHMDVIGSDGTIVGKVDHVQGNDIKLTKGSDVSGQHHLIPLSWVTKVDMQVHLSKSAQEAKAQ